MCSVRMSHREHQHTHTHVNKKTKTHIQMRLRILEMTGCCVQQRKREREREGEREGERESTRAFIGNKFKNTQAQALHRSEIRHHLGQGASATHSQLHAHLRHMPTAHTFAQCVPHANCILHLLLTTFAARTQVLTSSNGSASTTTPT
jgi:hypothetical protein